MWGRGRDSKHWGQSDADRTSAAALTASFTGTLIGPLMSLGKGGEGDENGICPSLLACYYITLRSVFIYESQPFLSSSVVLETALFCSYSIALILSVSSLAVSLLFIQDVVLLLVCITALLQSALFSPSPTLIATLKWQQTAVMTVCIFIISFCFAIQVMYVCVCSHQGCVKGV